MNVTLKTKATFQDSGMKGNIQSMITLGQQHIPLAAYILISVTRKRIHPSNSTPLVSRFQSYLRGLNSGQAGKAVKIRVNVCAGVILQIFNR